MVLGVVVDGPAGPHSDAEDNVGNAKPPTADGKEAVAGMLFLLGRRKITVLQGPVKE